MGRMPLHYDLHSHSIASDGTLSPVELVTAAHAAGVDVLALTDHDTLDGLLEAGDTARGLGLQLVPGVEISVSWQSQTIHILGLNVDPACETLQMGLDVSFVAGVPGKLAGAWHGRASVVVTRVRVPLPGAILSGAHISHSIWWQPDMPARCVRYSSAFW
jgi:hypothetical protein